MAERPPAVPVSAGSLLTVSSRSLWCQQVIPDEIFIQLQILIFPVAAFLVVICTLDDGRGRVHSTKHGLLWRNRDRDWFAHLAAEPASLPAEGAGEPHCVATRSVVLHATGVQRLHPPLVTLGVPPRRFPDILRFGKGRHVSVKVFIFAFKPFRVVSLLSGHGGLQVNHLEFLLCQSLLEPLQVGFACLQLGLDVLYRVQIHLGYFSVGKFFPPVFFEFLLLPHIDVHAGLHARRSLVMQVRKY